MRSLPAPPPRPCTAGGRPSPLANPYAFGRDGNREEVITQYRRWLWAQLQSPGSPQEREIKRLLTQAQSGELELLCWCAPLPCPAEVVRSALLWLAVEERAGAPAALLAQAAGIGWPVRSTHLGSAGSLGL